MARLQALPTIRMFNQIPTLYENNLANIRDAIYRICGNLRKLHLISLQCETFAYISEVSGFVGLGLLYAIVQDYDHRLYPKILEMITEIREVLMERFGEDKKIFLLDLLYVELHRQLYPKE